MTFFEALPRWLKSLLVTAFAFGISWFTVYDLTSISYFAPMEKVSDFRFSDFYMAVANDRATRTLDPNVAIVALDGCTRAEIARAISDVDFCAPRAIGLDVAFAPPRPGVDDSELLEALSATPNLVLPVMADEITGAVTHMSHYDSLITGSGPKFAAINIEGSDDRRSTVREFRTGFGPGNSVPSMAAALTGAPADAEPQAISFASRAFNVFTPQEVLANIDAIEGRIVLMGKMADAADLHSTPLNNFMPGLEIHAHTVATILDDSAPHALPTALQWLLAAICCYAVVWLNLRLDGHAGDFAVRIVQFLLLYLMILCGTYMYARHNIDINFGQSMLMISLGMVATDVLCGFLEPGGIYSQLKKLYHRYVKKTASATADGDSPAVG